ncbi:DUF4164 family protein [Phenylobacterium sp.]|jgi:uncharacterized membrane protein YccC|uniref:DUF4164 family protein n=1 Tax=Phenylobacterium sp. TaxID=1871053 RepID=UPI002E2F9326|nr:DUF4164 family protein [Phenylobacterium sp.]HEX2560046.1 DUF4164 family protein [Phenylobacterium sp.]
MNAQPGGDSALDLAIRRLERAVAVLEQRLADRVARAGAEAGGLFDQDRAKLAAELDQARARERELEEAGAAASAALGQAIAQIKATLGQDAARAAEEA